jgi:hypothetical protein
MPALNASYPTTNLWLRDKGFTVKSLYNVLLVRQPVKVFKDLGKIKLPEKIKIFL